jgi:regulator of nucleoside diphosphate kinase
MRPPLLTELDHHRLWELLEKARRQRLEDPAHLNALARELNAAVIVPSEQLPPDVVTIGTRMKLELPALHSARTCTLVLPAELGISSDRVSVISPLGTALIGQRVGDDLEYIVRGRPHCVRIAQILLQPEARQKRYDARAAQRLLA